MSAMSPQEPSGKEHIQLRLGERKPSEKNVLDGIVNTLKTELKFLLAELPQSGRDWVRGKSQQELARSKEILSRVIERIERLSLDKREQQHRHYLERERQEAEINLKKVDAYFSSWERIARIIKAFQDMGIEIDIQKLLDEIPR